MIGLLLLVIFLLQRNRFLGQDEKKYSKFENNYKLSSKELAILKSF
jgi:hypothetical protein